MTETATKGGRYCISQVLLLLPILCQSPGPGHWRPDRVTVTSPSPVCLPGSSYTASRGIFKNASATLHSLLKLPLKRIPTILEILNLNRRKTTLTGPVYLDYCHAPHLSSALFATLTVAQDSPHSKAEAGPTFLKEPKK